MAPTLPDFQRIKHCVQYLDRNPNKPIFNPSNYYDGSNIIRRTWSGNKVEYHTTHDCLECYQHADRAMIINRRRLVLGCILCLVLLYDRKYIFSKL